LDPTGTNLKERLFWASVSQDPDERKAFYNVLRPLFAESPLALGTLQPVAAPGGPYNLQIETPTRSVPLEQMGSGIQQLVLLSGLITLSRAAIIAIEEPEMNLSWPTQKKLRLILQRMVEQRDAPPHQIFISSHSPLFEFYENFYRVEMVDGRTQVTRVENAERRRIFDGVLPPADKRAAWLHGENVVILPSYVVETLDVQQGDLVYFLPQKDRVLMLGEEDFADMTRPGDEEA
jgi:predicted ATPase